MSDIPPAKRRRTDPTLVDTPNQTEFSLSVFRTELACLVYLHMSNIPTKRTSWSARMERSTFTHPRFPPHCTRKPTPELESFTSDVLSETASEDDTQNVEAFVEVLLNGITRATSVRRVAVNRRSGGRNRITHNVTTKWVDRREVHQAATSQQLLQRLLSKLSVSLLFRFFRNSCAYTKDAMRAMRHYGKENVVNAFIHLFQTGQLPSERQEEEREVLDGFDASHLFEICGVSVPRDVMVEILSYLAYDRTLILTVGLVSWDFFALVLTSWNAEVKVTKQSYLTIPQTIYRFGREFCIVLASSRSRRATRNRIQITFPKRAVLTIGEMNGIFSQLSRTCLTKLTLRLGLDCGLKYLRMMSLLKKDIRKNGVFVSVRKLILPASSAYCVRHASSCDFLRRPASFNEEDFRSIRLVDFFPNAMNVKWPPFFEWCEGLERLHSVGLSPDSIHSFYQSPEGVSLLSSLRSMELQLAVTGFGPAADRLPVDTKLSFDEDFFSAALLTLSRLCLAVNRHSLEPVISCLSFLSSNDCILQDLEIMVNPNAPFRGQQSFSDEILQRIVIPSLRTFSWKRTAIPAPLIQFVENHSSFLTELKIVCSPRLFQHVVDVTVHEVTMKAEKLFRLFTSVPRFEIRNFVSESSYHPYSFAFCLSSVDDGKRLRLRCHLAGISDRRRRYSHLFMHDREERSTSCRALLQLKAFVEGLKTTWSDFEEIVGWFRLAEVVEEEAVKAKDVIQNVFRSENIFLTDVQEPRIGLERVDQWLQRCVIRVYWRRSQQESS